ncbi:uncharacterized protein MELLADRAFT_112153 [Melampsora larici-populina 98AG31]|uniref:Uncharacterized protein n=1 Tax=Melampsora larici-populina (strain 98AG31 / pathotype 3-4-7) TaxID=747676 RepID=F4S5J8_MELLP|nr:uncharacterized protein MELLADRAFT_112153 [Melampsora larici-populina 98AG31]EGG00038.1 hypothetical protein MELLADRAFT_112153 [Melampsora larici-populina 98AG31]
MNKYLGKRLVVNQPFLQIEVLDEKERLTLKKMKTILILRKTWIKDMKKKRCTFGNGGTNQTSLLSILIAEQTTKVKQNREYFFSSDREDTKNPDQKSLRVSNLVPEEHIRRQDFALCASWSGASTSFKKSRLTWNVSAHSIKQDKRSNRNMYQQKQL